MGEPEGDKVRGVGVSEALLEVDELELELEVVDSAMGCWREEEDEGREDEEEEEWKRGRAIEIFERAVVIYGTRADDVGRMGLLCMSNRLGSLRTMVWAMVPELPLATMEPARGDRGPRLGNSSLVCVRG